MGLLLSVLDHVKQAVTSPFEPKPQAQAQAQTSGVKALASSSSAAGSSGTQDPGDSAGITANDFLTLLVTEIQNQDPTTQTDPMQYITQLVGVNSLEQLVQMNQTLTNISSVTPAAQAASSSAAAVKSNAVKSNAVQPNATSSAAAVLGSSPSSAASSSAAGSLLPLGSNSHIPLAAETAVAHAFTHASALSTQALPPTQVPMNPEVMRALQQSIPGATFSGQSPLPAATPAGTGGTER